jgi:hypothetical protein
MALIHSIFGTPKAPYSVLVKFPPRWVEDTIGDTPIYGVHAFHKEDGVDGVYNCQLGSFVARSGSLVFRDEEQNEALDKVLSKLYEVVEHVKVSYDAERIFYAASIILSTRDGSRTIDGCLWNSVLRSRSSKAGYVLVQCEDPDGFSAMLNLSENLNKPLKVPGPLEIERLLWKIRYEELSPSSSGSS